MASVADAFNILNQPPVCRPPMWRSMVARHVVASTPADTIVDTRDMWLIEAINDERRRVPKKGAEMREISCKLRNARALVAASRPGGWRWLLEAVLCGGATDKECIKLLQLPFKESDILAFRRVYFDVDAYRLPDGTLSEVAVDINIISCSLSRMTTMDSHDYMWKRVASKFGAEAFMQYYKHGPTPTMRDWQILCSQDSNMEKSMMFAVNPQKVLDMMGSDMAANYMKNPGETRATEDKKRAAGMGSIFEEYFSVMAQLVSKAAVVVTDRTLLKGMREIDGRTVQTITSGNLVKPYALTEVSSAEG